MLRTFGKIIIVSLVAIAPAKNSFADDEFTPTPEPGKTKTVTICKRVLPKTNPGPWTIKNQIPVKVCKKVKVTSAGKIED